MIRDNQAKSALPPHTESRFDRMEWAGAFGDLGTFIPFVIAYIGVTKVNPFGVLFAFGVALIICGAYYRTPLMKAVGTVAATQAAIGASRARKKMRHAHPHLPVLHHRHEH